MKLLKGIASLGLVTLACVTVTGCKKEYSGAGEYTYNQSLSTFPNNWNPFTYQTATASDAVNSYTESGLYTFDYNSDLTGYKMVNDMAVGEPKDVTENYVGEEWGIEEGSSARAWEFEIRSDVKWDDGTPITAETVVESYKRLLDPVAQNYRADQYTYSGNLVIHNARNYLFQGQEIGGSSRSKYDTHSDNPALNEDGTVPEGAVADFNSSIYDDVYFNIAGARKLSADEAKGPFKANMTVEASDFATAFGFVSAGYGYEDILAYLTSSLLPAYTQTGATAGLSDEEAYNKLYDTLDSMDLDSMTTIQADANKLAVWNVIIGWWQTNVDEEFDFFTVVDKMPVVDFDQVGVVQTGNYKFVLVLDQELSGFYLKYSVGLPLVKIDLYDSLASVSNGVYTNSYGTSVETSASYGPYKLTAFTRDNIIELSRNDQWYGYNDKPAGPDWYQTSKIVTRYIVEDSTREQAFLSGQLASFGLTAQYVDKYSSSDSLYYATSDSTFFVAINPYADKLGDDATLADKVLGNLNFRKALSFALNRKEYALAVVPTNNAASSVFSNYIISDPEAGTSYRSEEVAKDVVLEFWGLTDEVGEGKLYATKDEAIASITGVDEYQAKECFNAAADELIASGVWDGTSTFEIVLGMPSTSATYQNGYDYLTNQWAKVAQGTKFEGKITFKSDSSIADNFGEALRTGIVDILYMVGWTGSALDPYGLVSAYIDDNQRYDQGVNYHAVSKDVTFDSVVVAKDEAGKEQVTLTDVTLRVNIYDLACSSLAGKYIQVTDVTNGDGEDAPKYYLNCGSSASYETRLKALAACEGAILEQYTMLPLIDDSSASLKSYKINYKTETYVFGMGFGGIKYYSYNYDDAQWAEYVDSQGGTLTYN